MQETKSLVAIDTTGRLIVEPIWEKPIDDIEGKLYQKYIKTHPKYDKIYVRPRVASKLARAARQMPARYRLIIRAGHRPLAVQYQLLEMVKNNYKKSKPNVSEKMALAYARKYVSDPTTKTPPHCSGAAVDVDVLDLKTGNLVDFGCPMNTDDEISHINTTKISLIQKTNRDMLQKVMLDVGLAPFSTEWWHFSYGDDVWAKYYDKPGAIYGIVEPEL